jgi:hypothetical protein
LTNWDPRIRTTVRSAVEGDEQNGQPQDEQEGTEANVESHKPTDANRDPSEVELQTFLGLAEVLLLIVENTGDKAATMIAVAALILVLMRHQL